MTRHPLLHTHEMHDTTEARASLDAAKALFRARRRFVPEVTTLGPGRLPAGEAHQADIRICMLIDGDAWDLEEIRLGRPIQEGDVLVRYSLGYDDLACRYQIVAGATCLR